MNEKRKLGHDSPKREKKGLWRAFSTKGPRALKGRGAEQIVTGSPESRYF